MPRPRGNPNWGKPNFYDHSIAVQLTAYERALEDFKVSPERACHSSRVRKWVQANYRKRYVPTEVLIGFGLPLYDANLSQGEEVL